MLPSELLENLDCLSIDPQDLIDYANRLNHIALQSVADQRTRDRLDTYARRKAQAMRHRLDGRINEAMEIERYLDLVYRSLPRYARW